MFNINKFCDKKCNNVQYNQIVTGSNNPQISTRMLYAQNVSKKAKPIFVQNTQYLTSVGDDIYMSGSRIIGNIINGNIINININNGTIINGNLNGYITGNIIGDLAYGNMVINNASGYVNGNINGSIYGNVFGNIYGNINGHIYGNLFGGNIITSSSNINFKGNVYGNINGIVNGTVYGNINGGTFTNGIINNENIIINSIYNKLITSNIMNGNIVNGTIDINNNGKMIYGNIDAGVINYGLVNGIPITNKSITNGIIANSNINNGTTINGNIINGMNSGGIIIQGTLINGTNTDGSLGSNTPTDGIISNGTLSDGIINDGIIVNGSINNGIIINGNIANGTISDGIINNGNITNGIITNGNISTGFITDGYLVSDGYNITKFYLIDRTVNFTNTFDVNVDVIKSYAVPNYFNNFLNINIPIGINCSGTIISNQNTSLSLNIKTTINTLYYDVYVNNKLFETIVGISNNNMNIITNNISINNDGTNYVSIKQYLANYYGISNSQTVHSNKYLPFIIDVYCRANLTQTITTPINNLGTLYIDIVPSIIINIVNGTINNAGYSKFLVTDG
jgi:hypothetical protein